MIKSMTKKTNNKKGFTLIELIVVIAILGILAAIAIPRFAGIQEKSRESADEATIKIVEKAAELHWVQSGENTAKTYTFADLGTAGYIVAADIKFESIKYGTDNTYTGVSVADTGIGTISE